MLPGARVEVIVRVTHSLVVERFFHRSVKTAR